MQSENPNNEGYEGLSRRCKSNEGYKLMEENNIYEKNIINLVKEIREYEKKIEEKKKDKNIKYKEKLSQNQYPKIKLTPLNNQTIQYILSCKFRTPNMLIILNAFLSTMKFLSISADNEDKEKLLYSLSFCLKMDKKSNGSIIFRYGNKGTRFYIVLGGEVSVLILREKCIEITSLNYFKYLFYLKIIKEDELAKKILEANRKISFNINEKFLDAYYDEIISFINKYYTVIPVNESENNDNKKDNINKHLNQKENNDVEYSKGLSDSNNKSEFNNDINNNFAKKTFTKRISMAENRIISIQRFQTKNKTSPNNKNKQENKKSDSENDNSEISNKSILDRNKEKNNDIKLIKKEKKSNEILKVN